MISWLSEWGNNYLQPSLKIKNIPFCILPNQKLIWDHTVYQTQEEKNSETSANIWI